MPYVIAALLMLGIGGWFIINRQPPATPPNPFETAETTTPATPPDPTLKITTTPTPQPVPGPAPTPAPASPPVTPTVPPPPVKPAPAMPPATVTVPPAAPATASEPIIYRLSQLESQFQTAFEREVNTAYTEQLNTLGAGYATALDRATQDATKAGRLDEALALREEKQRFTTHKFMPSIDPSSLHKSVVTLRNAYRTAEKKYAEQKDASSIPLYDRYIELLNVLEKEVLAQGRSAEAAAVRTKRDDVIARRRQRAAKASSRASISPPAAPTAGKLALFDGESLSGWRVIGDAGSFTAISGEIRSNARPGNWVYVGTTGVAPAWKDFALENQDQVP